VRGLARQERSLLRNIWAVHLQSILQTGRLSKISARRSAWRPRQLTALREAVALLVAVTELDELKEDVCMPMKSHARRRKKLQRPLCHSPQRSRNNGSGTHAGV